MADPEIGAHAATVSAAEEGVGRHAECLADEVDQRHLERVVRRVADAGAVADLVVAADERDAGIAWRIEWQVLRPITRSIAASTADRGVPRGVSPIPSIPASVLSRMMNFGTSSQPGLPHSLLWTVLEIVGTTTFQTSTPMIFTAVAPQLSKVIHPGETGQSPERRAPLYAVGKSLLTASESPR